jgi:hypothetical protein
MVISQADRGVLLGVRVEKGKMRISPAFSVQVHHLLVDD